MIENLWDEIDRILAKEKQTSPAPLWIDLMPNGKTLIVIYPGKHRDEIAEAIIDELGEPERAGHITEDLDTFFLILSHQNLPENIKDIAERMTTVSLLKYLGFRPEGGIVI